MKKNPLKYLLSENLYLITGLLTTGTILQTFFLEMGLDEKSISYFEAISLIVQSASIFLLSGFIEKKSDIKALYILQFVQEYFNNPDAYLLLLSGRVFNNRFHNNMRGCVYQSDKLRCSDGHVI